MKNVDVIDQLIVTRQQEKIYQYTDDIPPSIHRLREEICNWNFQVIDHCDLDREVASISLNYLDRYLISNFQNGDWKTMQLAAITALYIAVKVHHPFILRVSSLIEMSRNMFIKDDIYSMEKLILRTLSRRMNPPTSLSFVRNFICILTESGCSPMIASKIEELSQFLTELSVFDYYLATRRSSVTGLGAVLVSIESTELDLPTSVHQSFFSRVQSICDMEISSEEIQKCKQRLYEIYLTNDVNGQVGRIDARKSPLIDEVQSSPSYTSDKL